MHDPRVLILDEPTDGLDPNQKHDVRVLIKKLAKEKCILISTHILEEVEELCDRCIIIGEGRKLFEGTPGELRSKSTQGRIQDVFVLSQRVSLMKEFIYEYKCNQNLFKKSLVAILKLHWVCFLVIFYLVLAI